MSEFLSLYETTNLNENKTSESLAELPRLKTLQSFSSATNQLFVGFMLRICRENFPKREGGFTLIDWNK